ncbi:unnamed protein product [Sphagnum balticum]
MSDVVTLPAQLSPMPSQSKERSLFNLPPQAEGQTTTKEAGENPFASPGSGTKETSAHGRPEEDPSDGWIFKAKKRGSTRVVPRLETSQAPSPTPRRTPTPGDKRGSLHSDLVPSFFEAIEIDAQVATRDALVSAQGGPNEECEASILSRITLVNPPGSTSQAAA